MVCASFSPFMRDRSDQPSSHKAPSSGRKGKRKRGPEIFTGIPLDEDELVNEVTVTRRGGRIRTTSRLVCIPLPPAPRPTDTIPDAAERDGDVYSDTEGMELLPETRNHTQKGSSRSVSVSLAFVCTDASYSITNNFLDTHWGMGAVQG